MAKENKGGAPAPAAAKEGAVSCCVEKCVSKGYKMAFCEEHYHWFKEGLVDRKGNRPSDFDKKFQAYNMRHKKKAS